MQLLNEWINKQTKDADILERKPNRDSQYHLPLIEEKVYNRMEILIL